jgi:hypothetical protein
VRLKYRFDVVKVREYGSAYEARCCGKRASSTMTAEMAARNAVAKAFGCESEDVILVGIFSGKGLRVFEAHVGDEDDGE